MIHSIYYRRLLLPLSVLLIGLTGCSSGNVPIGDEMEAKRIAENYYSLLLKGQIDEAVQLYKPDQQGHWMMFLQNQAKELGIMTKYSFKSSTVNTVFSGKFYIFQVGTRYGDQPADEILTLFLHVDEDEIHVASHKVNLAHSKITAPPSN